jgi:group I intron endonuclease
MYTVYKLTNQITGQSYIGYSKQVRRRMYRHKRNAKLNVRGPLYDAIREYGMDNFSFNILFETDNEKEADSKEIELIKEYNTTIDGYNVQSGGKEQIKNINTKTWKIFNKITNETVIIENLSQYCRENDYKENKLRDVAKGRRKSYKGLIISECS